MTNRQLPFDLKAPPAMGAADFVTSSSNEAALALIDSWPNWPGPALSVHGPAGCGKTHLGHVWQEKVGAQALFLDAPTTLPDLPSPPMLILDEPALDETEFFHLLNRVKNDGGALLILSREAPARWDVSLPDLASRLKALPTVEVAPPGDALLAAVLVKHFTDRQINVAPDVIDYLLRHIERSFAAAADVADRLDHAALAERKAITIPLVKRVLG
ncbi:DnaA/Hda family protein [Dongia mobilis]|jgi:chromosomal replication initiation ATPase DnaA|uniref:HdaA/DnaA family protein n=1 Tax=Dongia sp. TaxID=1977262 RepID=UPI0026EC772E